MDNGAITSAVAALLGSLIGASGSVVTTWIVQRSQYINQQRLADRARREALYSEFITKASKRFGEAMLAEAVAVDHLGALYSLVSRMRLFADAATVEAAEKVMSRLVEYYYGPPLTPAEMREVATTSEGDPLRPFSEQARTDLLRSR